MEGKKATERVKLIEEREDDKKVYAVKTSGGKDEQFIVDARYELIDMIGSGAYGIVCAAKDHGDIGADGQPKLVAIKKIIKAFEHRIFALRTIRELKIQRLLDHENVLGIRRILKPDSRKEFDELYVVTELMETDLTTIIKSKQALTEDHYQFFLYQILRGLKYTHSAGVYHRDLKPRNLLVNSNCDLKICDFGLARADIEEISSDKSRMTDYVVTRWYRAPEIIFQHQKYTAAVDVWAVGCIFAELILRKPLMPAGSEKEQLQMITNLIGNPDDSLITTVEDNTHRQNLKAQSRTSGKFD